MITLIFATVFAGMGPAESPLMTMLVERVSQETAFVIESRTDRPDSSNCDIVLRRESDLASIKFNTQKSRSLDIATKSWIAGLISATGTNPTTFSGLPLGHNVHKADGRGGMGFTSRAGLYTVQISISAYQSLPGNPPTFSIDDRESDQQLIEGLTRFALAAANGLDSHVAEPLNVAGTQVSTVTGTAGGRLANLRQYCQAKGVTVDIDSRASKATFTFQGRLVTIPLAATKISAGQTWIESDDISILRAGEWFVSYAALQSATQT